MVRRVASSALWALKDEGSDGAACRIDVHTFGDVESFDSPDDFLDHVTSPALRRFDQIAIAAGNPALTVRVSFVRKYQKRNRANSLRARVASIWRGRRVDSWPPRGVLLEVLGQPDTDSEKCARVRDRVAAAIHRGVPSHARRLTGTTSSEAAVRDLLEAPAIDWHALQSLDEPNETLGVSLFQLALTFPIGVVVLANWMPELLVGLFTREKAGPFSSLLPSGDYEVLYWRIVLFTVVTVGFGLFARAWSPRVRPSVGVAGLGRFRPARLRPIGNHLAAAIVGLAVTVLAAKFGIASK
jgi:hypothetical protein